MMFPFLNDGSSLRDEFAPSSPYAFPFFSFLQITSILVLPAEKNTPQPFSS